MPVPDANGCTVGSSRHASSVKPNARDDLELEHLLRARGRKRASAAARGAGCGDLLDERRLVLLQVVEDAADLGGLHPALVVVEHDVVRLVARPRSTRCSACADRGSCAAPAGRPRSRCSCAPRPRPGSRAPPTRDISARRSAGTLLRLLPVARGDADRLASNESYSCCSPQPRSSSSSRPTSAR